MGCRVWVSVPATSQYPNTKYEGDYVFNEPNQLRYWLLKHWSRERLDHSCPLFIFIHPRGPPTDKIDVKRPLSYCLGKGTFKLLKITVCSQGMKGAGAAAGG